MDEYVVYFLGVRVLVAVGYLMIAKKVKAL